jgi:hypothetical protein
MARNNSTKKPILSGVPEGADQDGFKHGRYTVEAICPRVWRMRRARRGLLLGAGAQQQALPAIGFMSE